MPILLIFLFHNNKKQNNTKLLINTTILIKNLFSLKISIITYFHYFFHLKKNQLIIQKNIFNHNLTKLPFKHIQNLYIKQNILHHLLNIINLQINSANNNKHKITINTLKHKNTKTIQSYILKQKHKKTQKQSSLSPKTSKQNTPLTQSIILHLTFKNLLQIKITQNHLTTAKIIINTIFNFLFTIANTFKQNLIKTLIKH